MFWIYQRGIGPTERVPCDQIWKKVSSKMLLFFSRPLVSNCLQPLGLQHTRPPLPSPSPEVCPSSWPWHWRCCPAISSSDTIFSFYPQSFPASWVFPMSQLFISGDQNTRASASASVLLVCIQGWFPLRLTGLISLPSKGSQESSPAPQFEGIFGTLPSLRFSSHKHMWSLGRPLPWLYERLSSERCLCFSTHCLGFSWLSCQEAIVNKIYNKI